MIHSSMPKKIILAFDEGVEEGKIVSEAEKLKAINPYMERYQGEDSRDNGQTQQG